MEEVTWKGTAGKAPAPHHAVFVEVTLPAPR